MTPFVALVSGTSIEATMLVPTYIATASVAVATRMARRGSGGIGVEGLQITNDFGCLFRVEEAKAEYFLSLLLKRKSHHELPCGGKAIGHAIEDDSS